MKRDSSQRFTLIRAARILALALLIPALSSCVTYYYPAPEYVDSRYDAATDSTSGVYYASDDPAYTVSSIDYVGVSYYPWWSVDYFYLGYGYYGSGVSIGFSYGYPWWPTHSLAWYPYGYVSWYHDPWRYSWWYRPPYYYGHGYRHHHHQAYWHVHNRHQRDRRDYHRGQVDYRPYDDSRYADNAGGRNRNRQPEPDDTDFGHYRATGYGRDEIGSWSGNGGTQRRVSVAPGNGASDRGMVVANRDGGKWSRSELEPVGAATRVRVTEPVDMSRAVPSDRGSRTVRSGSTTIVSPAQSKVSRSRTSPVSDPVRVGAGSAPARLAPTVSRPARVTPSSRSPAAAPPRASRVTPSRPSAKAGGRSRVTPAPAPKGSKRKD